MDTYEGGYSDGYAEGFDKGAEEGFKEGLAEGDASGFGWAAFGILSGIFLAHSGFDPGSFFVVGVLFLLAWGVSLVGGLLRVDSHMETLKRLNREHGVSP